ncbi:MAG: hydrogenase expression/formation C-terminal domain-containing protein [Roseiarcus sp.]
MKAGFWVAPEGEDAAVTLTPIAVEPIERMKTINLLATAAAEETIRRCRRTAALLPELIDALARQKAASRNCLFDITDFGADDRALIDDVLGEGEVAGVAVLPNGLTAQIQEAVMAGLWRVRFTDASGAFRADYIEVGAIPQAVREACAGLSSDLVIPEAPAEAMNVMPVLAEIRDRMARLSPGDPAHVVTFSLLPMTPADMEFLQATLGVGPVRLVSRGYGFCRVVSTSARNVWSVQFANAMDTVVLDTLEIGDVPAVALAADEDFADSAARLKEIEEAYFR